MRCASVLLLTAITAAFHPATAFAMEKPAKSSRVALPLASDPRNRAFPDLKYSNNLRLDAKLVSIRRNERHLQTKTSTQLSSISLVNQFRGGADSLTTTASFFHAAKNWNASPKNLFNTSFVAIALLTATFKVLQKMSDSSSNNKNDNKSHSATQEEAKPKGIKDLQVKFLSVFWLLRCADWLQGPYFYEVYASKVFNGVPASIALISRLFLTGFASTALFGPLVGRAVDQYGRKRGTIAFSLIYAVGAISTKSPLLLVLFLGRVFSGIGTSLLFSAPESWLVAESQAGGDDPDGKYLGETFGLVRHTFYCRSLNTRNHYALFHIHPSRPLQHSPNKNGPHCFRRMLEILLLRFWLDSWRELLQVRKAPLVPLSYPLYS